MAKHARNNSLAHHQMESLSRNQARKQIQKTQSLHPGCHTSCVVPPFAFVLAAIALTAPAGRADTARGLRNSMPGRDEQPAGTPASLLLM